MASSPWAGLFQRSKNLELTRREHKLTWEQFSEKLDVGLEELIAIESDERYRPMPRAVTRIARFMQCPRNSS
jgi:DNA-binding XRE family transcriptional regulator